MLRTIPYGGVGDNRKRKLRPRAQCEVASTKRCSATCGETGSSGGAFSLPPSAMGSGRAWLWARSLSHTAERLKVAWLVPLHQKKRIKTSPCHLLCSTSSQPRHYIHSSQKENCARGAQGGVGVVSDTSCTNPCDAHRSAGTLAAFAGTGVIDGAFSKAAPTPRA